MKAIIRDRDVLASVKPLELTAYLRGAGWSAAETKPQAFAQWLRKDQAGEEYEVVVPLDRNVRDYASRIADALSVLEVVERRSQTEIARDLQTTSTDVLRIRLQTPESADGTLELLEGVGAYEHARELMMAGACAAIRPRAWYRRKPGKADNFVRGLRLGQTEQGSYVISIHSRVTPLLQPATDPSATEVEDPFERQVMSRLANAIQTARRAAELSAGAGNLDGFQQSVNAGVSANLCEAIAGITEHDNKVEGVSFEFSWSRSRAQTQQVPSRIEIPSDAMLFIGEAGRVLRASTALEEAEVKGIVVRLDWPTDAPHGTATIYGSVEGLSWQVNVRAELSQADNQIAHEAFSARRPVSFRSDVTKEGKAYVAHVVRDFGYAEE